MNARLYKMRSLRAADGNLRRDGKAEHAGAFRVVPTSTAGPGRAPSGRSLDHLAQPWKRCATQNRIPQSFPVTSESLPALRSQAGGQRKAGAASSESSDRLETSR